MCFNSRSNVSGETNLRKFLSKLFHDLGPPYANDRLPYVTILGIGWWRISFPLDRISLDGTQLVIILLRYGGVILCIHAYTTNNTLYWMRLSISNQFSFFIASVIWSYFPRFVIILAAAFNSLWRCLMM